jgi:hypothetical protein
MPLQDAFERSDDYSSPMGICAMTDIPTQYLDDLELVDYAHMTILLYLPRLTISGLSTWKVVPGQVVGPLGIALGKLSKLLS